MRREGKQKESVIWVNQRKVEMVEIHYHYPIEIISAITVRHMMTGNHYSKTCPYNGYGDSSPFPMFKK